MRADQIPSIILLVMGVALLVASLLSDVIGLGDRPGFGAQQALGAVIGAGLIAIGWYFTARKTTDKTPSLLLLVMGVALFAVSVLSDVVGLGDNPAFGKQQILGAIAGVLMAGVGLFFMRKQE
jgi:hypothetical protein